MVVGNIEEIIEDKISDSGIDVVYYCIEWDLWVVFVLLLLWLFE